MQTRSRSAVAEGQADEIAVVEDVVMRQRRALGRAGGAGGVLDVDGIVALQFRFAPLQFGDAHGLARTQQIIPIGIERKDVLQIGTARPHAFEHGGVERMAKTAAVQQHTDTRLSQDILQLVRPGRRD